ncbi:SDR family oxidoreductase [Streptosporangiaceae bacterium NEAU-GS5]|nr:SDR family oxidoreductase [Streptosporangiaceae bacterium NEAU-GS5]
MRDVVVTGGATGIGRAIAAEFRKSGDRVTITGRREGVLKETALSLGARYVAFDASDPEAVTRVLPLLPENVHVLVNNAGANTNLEHDEPGDLRSLAEAWRANLDSNLLSAVLVTTAMLPQFARNGRIINLGSIAARGTGSGSYGAAKAALESWTADLAAEVGPRGITANVVSPGLILDTEFFKGRLDDEGVRRRIESTRNGRAGSPHDIAATVRFLASHEAGHVTGQVIHVNGGAYLGR